jgi:hypothetical protein
MKGKEMSRIDRLKEYSKPTKGWQGAGRDQDNIDRWSDRATENSKIAPRASDGEVKLPPTGDVKMRSTKSAPRTTAEIDAHMRGKDDLNHAGSDYMKSIRRNA